MKVLVLVFLLLLIPLSYLAMYVSEWMTFGSYITNPKERRKVRNFLKRDDLAINGINDDIITARGRRGRISYIGKQKPFLPYYPTSYYVAYDKDGNSLQYNTIARRVKRDSELESLITEKHEQLLSKD